MGKKSFGRGGGEWHVGVDTFLQIIKKKKTKRPKGGSQRLGKRDISVKEKRLCARGGLTRIFRRIKNRGKGLKKKKIWQKKKNLDQWGPRGGGSK